MGTGLLANPDVITDWEPFLAMLELEMGTLDPLGETPPGGTLALQVAPLAEAPTFAPQADPPVPYTGPGLAPTWADVADWAILQTHQQMGAPSTTVNASTADLQVATDTAIGNTVKAMSGFVNQTIHKEQHDIAFLYRVIVAVAQHQDAAQRRALARIATLEAQMQAILTLAIPSLQAQILHAEQVAFNEAVAGAQAAESWAVEHIFRPLEEQLAQQRAQTKVQIDTAAHQTLQTALIHDGLIAAAGAAALAPVRTAVATLVDEAEKCGKPICAQFGPQTLMSSLLKKLLEGGILALLAGFALADPSAVAQAAVTFAEATGPTIENTVGAWLQDLHDITS